MTKSKKGILWPISIAAFLVCFVSYLIGVVVVTRKTSIEMVSPTVYEDELHYQDTIDAKNNAIHLAQPVQILQDEGQNVVVQFPAHIDPSQVSGFIKFIRPSGAGGDIGIPLHLNPQNNKQVINRALLKTGLYKFSVYWIYDNVDYLIEKPLTIKASM